MRSSASSVPAPSPIEPALVRLLALWLSNETELSDDLMRGFINALPYCLQCSDDLLQLFLFPFTLMTLEHTFRQAFINCGGIERIETLLQNKKKEIRELVREVLANCALSHLSTEEL